MSHDTPEHPTIEDHPGLDSDESTDEGKMMTAEGSTGDGPGTVEPPTLEDHPGLDNDQTTDEGEMMTAEGSTGGKPEKRDPA